MAAPADGSETKVTTLDSSPFAIRFALGMKAALALVFLLAIVLPLDHLEGKGMTFRVLPFMLSAALVPLLWRKRRGPYPAVADGLFVAPFLLDTAGNLLGIYDTFAHTDDVLHFINWVLLVGAFHAYRFRTRSSVLDAVLLGAGVGALAIVGWEIAEWIVAETGAGGGLNLTYGDTVGDLAISTSGGILGSLLGVYLFGPRQRD